MRWSAFLRRALHTVVTASLFASLAIPAFAAPTVWVAPSLVRVRPTDAAGTAQQITLYAAKGETESFQIIVQAPGTGALTNVNVIAPELGGPASTLYREHYLYLTRGSADWSSNRNRPLGAGYWPDGLVPFLDPNTGAQLRGGSIGSAPFTVAAGTNQPVWVDVYVPRSAEAGTYTGTYTVTSDQGEAAVSLTLRVWHFALPLQPALRSSFLYWPTVDGGEGRGVLQADQELLRNRLNPFSTSPSNQRGLIDEYGLGSSGLSFWSNDFNTMVMTPPPTLAEILADKARHQSDLYLYCYTADEVSNPVYYSGIRAWAQALHAAGVDQLVTTPPVPELYDDGMGTGRSAVDDWVVRPMTYVKYQSNVLAVQAKGDRVWSYNAAQPDDYSPKWLLDYAPINFRIQPGFISTSLGLVGLFYWRIDWWSADVWNGSQSWASYPGEGVLVYPGDPIGLAGQVVPSMRLKYLRDGVDDFDYLQLLAAQGEGAWAREVAAAVGPDWSNWTRSPDVLEAARLQLANKLENLATGETITVSASASLTVLPSGGSTTLSASASSSTGAEISAWSWSDGGAGGSFSPSTIAQNPTYTAAANSTGSSRTITLTVTVTAGTVSDSKDVSIVEQATPSSIHSLALNAYAAPATVSSGGSTAVRVTATDSKGHTGFRYAWSDNGAGGVFSPSATVAAPSYTPPVNTSGVAVTRTLTATVSCVWVVPSISARASVTVTSAPAHTLTAAASATPTALPAEGSTGLIATATDNEGHSDLTYAWSDGGAGGAFSPSAAVSTPTYTPPVNTNGTAVTRTLTVTVTCAAGSPPISASASVSVTSAAAHLLTVAASATPTALPADGSTGLIAAATDNEGHSDFAYAWSDNGAGGAFSPSAAVSTPTYTPPVNTRGLAVTRTLTVTVTCAASSPPVSASASVGVTSAAAHLLTVAASATPTALPADGSTGLSATVTDTEGHSDFTYAWSDNGAGGVFSPSAAVATPTYTPPVNGSEAAVAWTLSVTVGCAAGSSPTSASGSVTVTSAPAHTLAVAASANATTLPADGSTGLSAIVTDSQGHSDFAYTWSDNEAGGSFSPSATVADPTYTPPVNTSDVAVTQTLTVTVICAAGSSPLSASGSVTVTSTRAHALAVAALASPTAIAADADTELSAAVTDNEGHSDFAYAWDDAGAGGAFWPSAAVANPTYAPPVNTAEVAVPRTLTVTVTCAADSIPISATGSVTVTSAPAHSLTVVASASPTTLPADGSTLLSATVTDNEGHSDFAYTWRDNGAGGAFSPSAAVATPTYTPPANTSGVAVTRTLAVTVICSANSPPISATTSVSVTSAAAHLLTLAASAGTTTLASGGSTKLTAKVTDSQVGHTGFAYAWSDGGAGGTFSPSAAAASPTYTAPGNTTAAAVTRTLTVTVTCKWTLPWVSSSTSVALTESTAASAHALSVTASASPTTIASGRSTALSATATDNRGHTGVAYAWSDNGAGGAFSPSAMVARPTYTPPVNTSGATVTRRLTVTATCKWTLPWVSATANVSVLEGTQ